MMKRQLLDLAGEVLDPPVRGPDLVSRSRTRDSNGLFGALIVHEIDRIDVSTTRERAIFDALVVAFRTKAEQLLAIAHQFEKQKGV